MPQGDRLASFDRASHRVRVVGFDADNANIGSHLFYPGRDTGNEAAAAHRHEQQVDLLVGLLEDFLSYRALARDDVGIVEGMNEHQAFLLHECLRVRIRVVIGIAMQDYFATEPRDGLDLD